LAAGLCPEPQPPSRNKGDLLLRGKIGRKGRGREVTGEGKEVEGGEGERKGG